MSVTVRPTGQTFEEINVPTEVQVRCLKQSKQNPLNIRAIMSTTEKSTQAFIKCSTIDEVNSIKEGGFIKILNGKMHSYGAVNPKVVFIINKFEVINKFTEEQMGLVEARLDNSVSNQSHANESIDSVANQSQADVSVGLESNQNQCDEHIPNNTEEFSTNPPKRKITPLSMLTELNTNFTVEGVIAFKGDIKAYKGDIRANGGGELFDFIIRDKDKNEMKCTCLNDTCEKYYGEIKENENYTISKGDLQPLFKKKYARIGQLIDLECVITTYSKIEKNNDTTLKIDDTIPINKLHDCAINKLYSICCVILSIGEVEIEKGKQKRVVEVMDQTNWLLEVIFWEEKPKKPDTFKAGEIVKFHKLELVEKQYLNLKFVKGSEIIENPQSHDADLLRNYLTKIDYELDSYERFSDPIHATNLLNKLLTLDEYETAIKDNNEIFKADVIAYVTLIRTDDISNFVCNKCGKIIGDCDNDDDLRCPHCSENCKRRLRYKLKVKLEDSTTSILGVMYDEAARHYLNANILEESLVELKKKNYEEYINFFKKKSFIKARFGLMKRPCNVINIITSISFITSHSACRRTSRELCDIIDGHFS
ncbi:Replication factor A protein 1 [Entamoeba marina]